MKFKDFLNPDEPMNRLNQNDGENLDLFFVTFALNSKEKIKQLNSRYLLIKFSRIQMDVRNTLSPALPYKHPFKDSSQNFCPHK